MHKLDAIFVASVNSFLAILCPDTKSISHILFGFPLNNLLLGTGICQDRLAMQL